VSAQWPVWEKIIQEGAGTRAPQDAPEFENQKVEPRGRQGVTDPKGPATTELLREEVATRPTVVFVGTVTASTEIGLGSPTTGGQSIRRVRLRLRTTVAPSPTDYWTLEVFWKDDGGNESLIGSSDTTAVQIPASMEYAVWHAEAGVRIESLHEVTLKLTKTGSAPDLVNVTVYPDWFAGI
jgi:hypothetical protein